MALAPRSTSASDYGNGQRASWVLSWPSLYAGDLLVGVLITRESGVDIYDHPGFAKRTWNSGSFPSVTVMWHVAGEGAVGGGFSQTWTATKPARGEWRTWVIPAGQYQGDPEWFVYGNNDVGPQMPYLADLEAHLGADLWPYADGLFAATHAAANRENGAAVVQPATSADQWFANLARTSNDFYMVSGRSDVGYNPLRVWQPNYNQLANANVLWRTAAFLVRPKRPPIINSMSLPRTHGSVSAVLAARENPETFRIEWGDGAVSTGNWGQAANHAYQYGTYTVTATVSNNKGTSSPATGQVTIPRPTISQVTHSQVGDRVTLTAQATDVPPGATWTWDYGDGSGAIAGLGSVVNRYYPRGDYTVTVSVQTSVGESATFQYALTVLPPAPLVEYIYVRTPGTYDVLFSDRSTDADSVQWAVDGVDMSTDRDYLHVFPGAGQYVVRLTATNAIGTDYLERTVHITDEYTALDRQDGTTVALVLDAKDVSCEVMGARWSFGATDDEGPLTVQRSGRLTLRLSDRDRDLDPWQNGARYGDAAAVGHNVFFYVGRTGSTDPLTLVWRGWVSDTSHDGLTLELTGYDSIGRLAATIAGQDGPTTRPQETLYDRLIALLDIAGWPTSLRDIVGGTGATVRETTFAGQDVWTQLQAAASGVGFLAVLPDGTVRYRDGFAAAGDVVQMGDGAHGLTGTVLPVAADGVHDAAAVTRVINDAVVGNDVIGNVRVQDPDSQAEHGLQSTNLTTDLVTTAARDAMANALVDELKTPRLQMAIETVIDGDTVETAAPIRFGRPGHLRIVPPASDGRPTLDRDALLVLGGAWSMTRTTTRLSLALTQPQASAQAPVGARLAGLVTPKSSSTHSYGAGGLFSGVNAHDHQGGILRPAEVVGYSRDGHAHGYLTQAQVDARVNALTNQWARTGNAGHSFGAQLHGGNVGNATWANPLGFNVRWRHSNYNTDWVNYCYILSTGIYLVTAEHSWGLNVYGQRIIGIDTYRADYAPLDDRLVVGNMHPNRVQSWVVRVHATDGWVRWKAYQDCGGTLYFGGGNVTVTKIGIYA